MWEEQLKTDQRTGAGQRFTVMGWRLQASVWTWRGCTAWEGAGLTEGEYPSTLVQNRGLKHGRGSGKEQGGIVLN